METRDEDPVEEAPPGWVLRTPTRWREVWVLPVLALGVAALMIFAGSASADVLARVAWVTAAVVMSAGAVALAVSGWRAYRDQTRGASWDLHRIAVLAGVASGAVVVVASLVAGGTIGVAMGALGGLPTIMWFARSVTRFDRTAVSVACAVVAVVSLVLVVVGLTVEVHPYWRATVWTGVAPLIAVITAVFAFVQFRALARTPSD